jgi:hypothetical protein
LVGDAILFMDTNMAKFLRLEIMMLEKEYLELQILEYPSQQRCFIPLLPFLLRQIDD